MNGEAKIFKDRYKDVLHSFNWNDSLSRSIIFRPLISSAKVPC